MTRSIGNRIPPAVRSLLDGLDLHGRAGITFLLATVAAEGWPHLAMLSVGEVLEADDGAALYLALWPSSATTERLATTGQGVLALVDGQIGYEIRLRAERQDDLALPRSGRLACFRCSVHDVLEDVVTYATLVSGITYRLHDPGPVLERWQETVEALRQRAGKAEARRSS